MSWPLLVLGLILFVGLVVVHEFGHYLVARRNGVEVEEFGIGFPPRALVLGRKKGTVYTLNWLPLGGFVKLKGEHDADTKPGTFGAARLWAKVKIMMAGVGMNLLTAFVIFTVLALIGLPTLIDNQFTVASNTRETNRNVLVALVEYGSPAQKAGLQLRDQLISIGTAGHSPTMVNDQADLPNITKALAGQTAQVIIKRQGQTLTKTVTLRDAQAVAASKKTRKPVGYLGVSPGQYSLRRSTWSAPIVALGIMKQVTIGTLQGLRSALSGLFQGDTAKASSQVTGPVGIFVLLKDGSFLGVNFILMVVGLISLALAIMNALPIPALDGGRLFVILLFRVIKKPLTASREELISGIGIMVLLTLGALVTFVDIKRNF